MMPKQVYVKGIGYVRAGSWSTKDFYDKWKRTMKLLEDTCDLLPLQIQYLFTTDVEQLPKHERDLALVFRECDEEIVINRLEGLRDWCDKLIRDIPKNRRTTERLQALENVAGRTPEEAAAFLAKAQQLRSHHSAT